MGRGHHREGERGGADRIAKLIDDPANEQPPKALATKWMRHAADTTLTTDNSSTKYLSSNQIALCSQP
jgi:hypothetical protein